MSDLLRHFQEGGFAMYPIACFGVLGVALALASLGSLFAPSRKFPIGVGLAAMIIGLMALGMGVAGTMLGRRATEDAIVMADPELGEMIRAQGYAEANNNLIFGGLVSAVPLLAGLLAIARGVTMKAPEKR
jgi:hypothetical protein